MSVFLFRTKLCEGAFCKVRHIYGEVTIKGYTGAMGSVRRFFGILLLLFFIAPLFAFAQTDQELKFLRILRVGMSGEDVKMLQQFLSRIPDTYQDLATGYFGRVTEAAVKKFQEREGVARRGAAGYGQAGPKTVAKINEVIKKKVAASASQAPLSASTSTPARISTSTPSGSTSSTTTPKAAAKAAAPAPDKTPPVRSGGTPGNVLSGNTTSATLSLTTNESARCFWSNTPGTLYDYMTTAFKAASGGTKHSYTLSSLTQGNYAFFVRCRDNVYNINATDYPILFSIEYKEVGGGDKTPPRVFISSPAPGDSVVEGLTNLAAAASDNTGVVGVRFFLNSQDLNFEDASAPYGVAVMLPAGEYRTFAVARDAYGNRATSTEVAFIATPKPAAQSASAFYSFFGVVKLFAKMFGLRF